MYCHIFTVIFLIVVPWKCPYGSLFIDSVLHCGSLDFVFYWEKWGHGSLLGGRATQWAK